ncbi:MAG: hypothetical protein PHN42_04535 [Bacilli bacterium]|nr:hypothetical protein [Bacilli bacterium]
MVFNKNINGYENEKEFTKYFNNKNINEFDIETVSFLETVFNNKLSNELVKCWRVPGFSKVDIKIKINDVIKNISIKKGIKNEVHTETIKNFIEFLSKMKIKKDDINQIKKYLYADGTINNTGEKRQSIIEYKINNQEAIDALNEKLNTKYIINKIINRFIIKGRISNLKIDAIIYGVTDDFLWITKNEIKKIIISKMNDYSTALHFGPLTIQSWDRNLKRNPKYEYRREYVQLKWYNISDDIIEIMAFTRRK